MFQIMLQLLAICQQLNCKHLLIVSNKLLALSYLISKCQSFFLVDFEQVFYKIFFLFENLFFTFLQQQFMKLFCKSIVEGEQSCKSQLFKVTNNGKPPPMIFSLTCNLLKMSTYSNDFQKIFLAKNPCDSKQIRSNQITAGVNALNHFVFNKSKMMSQHGPGR